MFTTSKIDHIFFSKLCANKKRPCNTDSLRLLVDYWETNLLRQNNVILHIKFIYTKHINQSNKAQALSVMTNRLSDKDWISTKVCSLIWLNRCTENQIFAEKLIFLKRWYSHVSLLIHWMFTSESNAYHKPLISLETGKGSYVIQETEKES